MPLVYFYAPNSNFRFLSWWGLMFDKNQPIYMMWKGVFIFTTCPPLFVDSNPLYPEKCENLFFDSYYNAQNHHIGNILYFNLYKYLHKIIKLAWNFQRHIPHIHLATLKVLACVDWIFICSKHDHLCHLRKETLTCHMSRAN